MSEIDTAGLVRVLAGAGLPLARVEIDQAAHTRMTLDLPAGVGGQNGHALKDARLIVSPIMCGALFARIVAVLRCLHPHLSASSRREGLRLTLDAADDGIADVLSFNRPTGSDWPLMPDLYLLETSAPDRDPSWRDFRRDFLRRRRTLFWRGSTTGGHATTFEELLRLPRVAACLAASRLPAGWSDCKIAQIVQAQGFDLAEAEAELRRRGVMDDWVDEAVFRDHRMTIDLPGNTAAWGTCRKYLAGCLVLRPPQGHELIYSGQLRPWEHYVPVREDLADLEERVAWARGSPDEAASVAWRGRNLMADVTRALPAMMDAVLREHGTTTISRRSDGV